MAMKVQRGEKVRYINSNEVSHAPDSACFLSLTKQVISCGEKASVEAVSLFTRNHMSWIQFKKKEEVQTRQNLGQQMAYVNM